MGRIMKIQPEDIRDSLAKLGDTPEKIAASLGAIGIKGDPESGIHCPLANYLNAEFGVDTYVGYDGIPGDCCANVGRAGFVIETAQLEFVTAFDDKEFPELISEEFSY